MIFGNAKSDATTVVIQVDRAEQMAIYDSLPPSWRYLVNELPQPQELGVVREFLLRFGETDGYRRIVEVFRKSYPGWTPP